MTYQEYFKQTNFEEIWALLSGFYAEPEEARPLYENLVNEIVALPIEQAHCDKTIKMSLDFQNEIKVEGAPDPQEWLVGREVIIDFGDIEGEELPDSGQPIWLQTYDALTDAQKRAVARNASIGDIAGHLLYWSTMYGIRTTGQYHTDFSAWLAEGAAGPYFDEDGIMIKYIFLDFDGVLNTEQYQAELRLAGKPTADEYGPLFAPKAVARLGEIIEKTNAKIIITSSWRYIHDQQALNEMWEKRGLPGNIYGILSSDYPEESRGKEITAYLAHETNTPYIILDDLDEFLPEQKEAFIEVNPVTGISQNDVNKAIEILNRFDDKPLDYFIDTKGEKKRHKIGSIEAESRKRKRLKYWRDTICYDSAIDWSWNLTILQKKLEYNIGYWRYVQRHVGWEEDVKRMQLCCRLLQLAAVDYPDMEGVYVNERNAARYKIEVDHDELLEVHLKNLRREKAFRLVWRFIEHNMKRWWD